MDLNLSSPAVSQMLSWISSPVLVFIFFYWYAPARVGSWTFLKTPSLYRIVMEVFPTAAFPHRTNLTARLDELGLCRIFDLPCSLDGFSFLQESHIKLIIITTPTAVSLPPEEQLKNEGKGLSEVVMWRGRMRREGGGGIKSRATGVRTQGLLRVKQT